MTTTESEPRWTSAEPSRWRRVRAPALTIGGLALATLALHVRDPHVSGAWGFCPSAMLGIYCPGCGGLRAVNDLTNGQVGAALSSNLLAVLLIPVGIALLAIWFVIRWRGIGYRRHPALERRALMVLAVACVAFMVVRNLPFGAWLAP